MRSHPPIRVEVMGRIQLKLTVTATCTCTITARVTETESRGVFRRVSTQRWMSKGDVPLSFDRRPLNAGPETGWAAPCGRPNHND